MHARTIACISSTVLLTGMTIVPAQGGDWPFGWKAEPGTPNTLTQIARSIDDIEDKILDDGTVVIKQPDVWGQARMTLYRKDFETMMKAKGPDDFQVILAARVSRLDAAAAQSQTSLSASLATAPTGRGRSAQQPAHTGSANAVTAPTVVALSHPSGGGQSGHQFQDDGSGGSGSGGGGGAPGPGTGQFWNVAPLPTDAPFALLQGKQPFGDMSSNYGGKLGLDPPVFLDEKKRFFDHLNQIRRVNIGDDNADSAGYGLYLVRMPISIQPGELTLKGHGAVLTATARHEFDANFLKNTFHNLVINDLVDQLGPVVYELIRNGVVEKQDEDARTLGKLRQDYFNLQMEFARRLNESKTRADDIMKRIKSLKVDVEKLTNRLASAKVIGNVERMRNKLVQFRTEAKTQISDKYPSAVVLMFNDIVKVIPSPGEPSQAADKSGHAAIQQAIRVIEDAIRQIQDLRNEIASSIQPSTAAEPISRDQVDSEKAHGPKVIQVDLAEIEKNFEGLKVELQGITKDSDLLRENFKVNLGPGVFISLPQRVDLFNQVKKRGEDIIRGDSFIPVRDETFPTAYVDLANDFLKIVQKFATISKQNEISLDKLENDLRAIDPRRSAWINAYQSTTAPFRERMKGLLEQLTDVYKSAAGQTENCLIPTATSRSLRVN